MAEFPLYMKCLVNEGNSRLSWPLLERHLMKSLETERIQQAYARRDRDIDRWRYSPFNPDCLYITQQRERAILRILSQHNVQEL